MRVEKRVKLYELDTEVWLPEDAKILGLVFKGKLFQLVVWENTMPEIRLKRRFVWIVANDVLLVAEKALYVGAMFDPELTEMIYVFELR